MPPDYAELHCISNFTFLRGASHPEELVARAAALGYSALALTDECSLAGAVRAHLAAKTHGIKLIVGSELRLDAGLRLLLLVADREGYGNLCALITRARRAAVKGTYRLAPEDLDDGLPGCLALLVPGEEPEAAPLGSIAGRFSGRAWLVVELLRAADDRRRLDDLSRLGCELGLPLVAAGDVHMHVRSRRKLQDTLTAIRLGCTLAQAGEALYPNGERHLRPRERLARIYPQALLEQALAVAERCGFSLDCLRYEYPEELVPDGENPADYLRRLSYEGMGRRWPEGAPERVRKLVDHELALIRELAYEPYFLTVYDIVRFARERGILCQGRGSAANSAVCFCLGITEVDPARMQMLFERFISRERNEPPDIDVDFEHERREEVIQYIYGKYGRDRAALAATVITYRPKSAVRDVGKVLGLEPAQVDRLAGSLVWTDGHRVQAARLAEAGLDPHGPVLVRLLALVNRLLGFPRHLSQHVGGFVISRGPLCRLVPIENAAMAQRTVIQWDKDDLDALNLLKVDVLALGMLTAIRKALALVNARRTGGRSELAREAPDGCASAVDSPLGRPEAPAPVTSHVLTLQSIPPEDPEVYRMIQAADTVGVFQIESRAQMAMLPRLLPRTFYDLVIEVAIVRPGPIQGGMVHPYLRRRQGDEPVGYPSAAVRQVLERTLGVPIFQEQVMKLAVVAAGFSPGEADQLRRSMAAWRRRGGLEHFEHRLIQGMRERGYAEDFARQIYRQIQGFGEYGFPESHAASFALLVYVSAWLKHHEPAAFACALLNSQPMGFYAPSQLVQDARHHGVEVLPVDVCFSGWDCDLERPAASGQLLGVRLQASGLGPRSNHESRITGLQTSSLKPQALSLRLGLRLVKGLSRAGAERLVAARAQGPFAGVEDLARRTGLKRSELERLAAAGALAGIAGDRHRARWAVRGVEAMPGLLAGAVIQEPPPVLPPPGEAQDLVADYQTLGLSLGRHPLALLRGHLRRRGMLTAAQIRERDQNERVRAAGLVVNRQRPATASGVTFVTLEDETGYVNLVVWHNVAQRSRQALLGARLLGVRGVIEREGEVVHVMAGSLQDLSNLIGDLQARSRDFR